MVFFLVSRNHGMGRALPATREVSEVRELCNRTYQVLEDSPGRAVRPPWLGGSRPPHPQGERSKWAFSLGKIASSFVIF